ncbi:MAG TPA: lysophospholipid acyltransferase family protein [Steroidobacteraceae bacterium]|nr:lysophospholipid acyltransferase family protein [Steroidobacteraceae bacterium]
MTVVTKRKITGAGPQEPVTSKTPEALLPPSVPLRAGLWAASRSLRVLGPARYAFADVLGLAIYARSPERARRCAWNHRRLDPSITGAEARRRARGSFREFMRTSFDFVWEYAVPPKRMNKYFRAYGLENVYDALETHHGAVFAVAHYGSWDVAAANALACDIPITTVMTRVGTSDMATRIAAWARRHQEMEVLMTGAAARGLIRAARNGRVDAILCDIPDRGYRVAVDFCGGPVNFSTSPAWIARVTGVPIMPVHCWRENGLYRMVIFSPVLARPDDSDQDVMQRVASVLEKQIRRIPTQWYPFGNVYTD